MPTSKQNVGEIKYIGREGTRAPGGSRSPQALEDHQEDERHRKKEKAESLEKAKSLDVNILSWEHVSVFGADTVFM